MNSMHDCELMSFVEQLRHRTNSQISEKDRVKFAQYMTTESIAKCMASMFETITGKVHLLDAGAAIGSLSAAFVAEACKRNPDSLDIKAFEIDSQLVPHLRSTMMRCNAYAIRNDLAFSSRIINEDFIDIATLRLENQEQSGNSINGFTHAILNPPYKKIKSDSEEYKQLNAVGISTPNLYAGFIAAAVRLLRPGGEIVAIIPRSFCNGPYFRAFRQLLSEEIILKHIHVFHARNRVFRNDRVLQETIILHAAKITPERRQKGRIVISSSNDDSFADKSSHSVDYCHVIRSGDPEKFIHLPLSSEDTFVAARIGRLTHSLNDLGIQVSTGPVVDFRLRDYLHNSFITSSAPLLYPANINGTSVKWPIHNSKPIALTITEETRKVLWTNQGVYVLAKRFTTKEEIRRIIAVVCDDSLPGTLIGFENHLNVFHQGKQGMPKLIALGLMIYLNSNLVEQYFRQFNGHTQVNATDLRAIPYPSHSILEQFASLYINSRDVNTSFDEIVSKVLKDLSD